MFYKRRIAKQDTPADVAERIAYRQSSRTALAEMRIKFPILTSENFAEANDFMARRIKELKDRIRQGPL